MLMDGKGLSDRLAPCTQFRTCLPYCRPHAVAEQSAQYLLCRCMVSIGPLSHCLLMVPLNRQTPRAPSLFIAPRPAPQPSFLLFSVLSLTTTPGPKHCLLFLFGISVAALCLLETDKSHRPAVPRARFRYLGFSSYAAADKTETNSTHAGIPGTRRLVTSPYEVTWRLHVFYLIPSPHSHSSNAIFNLCLDPFPRLEASFNRLVELPPSTTTLQ